MGNLLCKIGLHKYLLVRESHNPCEVYFVDKNIKQCKRCEKFNSKNLLSRPRLDEMPHYNCICGIGELKHQMRWTAEKFEKHIKEKEALEKAALEKLEKEQKKIEDKKDSSLGRRFV